MFYRHLPKQLAFLNMYTLATENEYFYYVVDLLTLLNRVWHLFMLSQQLICMFMRTLNEKTNMVHKGQQHCCSFSQFNGSGWRTSADCQCFLKTRMNIPILTSAMPLFSHTVHIMHFSWVLFFKMFKFIALWLTWSPLHLVDILITITISVF